MGKDRLLKACAVCGAEFHAARASQVCCSQKCRRERKLALQRIRDAKRRVGKPLPQVKELVCPVCGKQFQSERGHKYCSEECRRQARKESYAQQSKQVSCDLTPPLTRKCHDCGAPTSNYRCPRCLSDWKIKHAVSAGAGDVDERYSICR